MRTKQFVLLIILTLLLAACGRSTPTPTILPEETGLPAVDPTTLASPTASTIAPTEAAPARVGVYPAENTRLVEQVRGLAQEAGFELVPLESLDGIDQDFKMVVAVPAGSEDTGRLSDIAAAQKETRIIVLGEGLDPGDNLSLVAGGEEGIAFLAGYTAALITPDWRVGILNQASETTVRDAFINGASYLCGVCTPKYPPYIAYPLAADAAGINDWQTGIDSLAGQSVTTVFLSPGLDRPEIREAVEAAGMHWLNAGSAPEEGQYSKWVASLSSGPGGGLDQAWADALSGQPGQRYQASAATFANNPDFLSDARLRLAQELAEELASGAVFTGSVPVIE